MALTGRLLPTGVRINRKCLGGIRWNTSTNQNNSQENIYSSDKSTHFGYETVSEQEKSEKVKAVFENVAAKYDLMNDCMSGGVHRLWKDIFIHRLNPGPSTRLIDVAGGTGDIAFRFLKHTLIKPELEPKKDLGRPYSDYKSAPHEEEPASDSLTRSVVVSDINDKMLEVGQARAPNILTQHQLSRIDWLQADAENLHTIEDESFDVYTIAYGIRNCVHIDKVLSEAYRVLKKGGRFMCLEFSHVTHPIVKWAYDQYSFQLIPVMGQVIAGDWDSYEYLVQSIRKFPNQAEFKKMIERAGFRLTTHEDLTFGVSCIHSGFKL